MAANWEIDWFICRADHADEAFNKQQRKVKTEKRVIKAGDELWRVPRSIGPITSDHSYWGGIRIQLNQKQAEWVSAACTAYEAAGNKFPEDD